MRLRKEDRVQRITVKEAAQELSMDPQCLRYMMRKGTLPIGHVLESEERCTYYIYREKLDNYLAGKT